MRAGKNQQLHLMAEEIRQRIESLRKENHQQRQWLDVRTTRSDGWLVVQQQEAYTVERTA